MIANNLIIGELKDDDILSVADLEQKTFSTPWKAEDLQRTITSEAEIFFVAKLQDQCVGYIGLLAGYESSDIITLCVSDEYRGRGIAARLLNFAIRYLRERQTEKIFLEVRESNTPARCLYEKFGFQYLNKRVRYYKDPVEDAWVMVKEIDDENFGD